MKSGTEPGLGLVWVVFGNWGTGPGLGLGRMVNWYWGTGPGLGLMVFWCQTRDWVWRG